MTVMARTTPSGTRAARKLSASIGSMRLRRGVLPSGLASRPSGRSFLSTRYCACSALSCLPSDLLARSAISAKPALPFTASATAKSSFDICTTWPSERRARYGGSLNPESSYSPISSTPCARATAKSLVPPC